MNFKKRKILVTGGTGFIGGRLVEKLVQEYQAKVRVLVRNFSTAPRIARLSIEITHGDVTDIGAVRHAAADCDIIFHCAYVKPIKMKKLDKIDAAGTEIVARVALEMKVARFIYISTISVYGESRDGYLDETSLKPRSGDLYSVSKLAEERVVYNYFKKYGLPAVIIQPTMVYGPFGKTWTILPLSNLKQGVVVLVDGGLGLCNAVYVDDVVEAMILAATKEEAIGEAFLVSYEAPITWKDFYGQYEKMLGLKATISKSADEIQAYYKESDKANRTLRQILHVLREKPNVRARLLQLPLLARPYRLIRATIPDSKWEVIKCKLLPRVEKTKFENQKEDMLIFPTKQQMKLYLSKTHVSIDKAERILDYRPKFSLNRGMELTAKWASWANLL